MTLPAPTTVAISLPTLKLSADESRLLARLRDKLAKAQKANAVKRAYYEGTHKARDLGIAIPPSLSDLTAHVGFAGTVVDVLAERLHWNGWAVTETDALGLDSVYAQNALDVEQNRAVLDALICGAGFIVVGAGDPSRNEPDVLVTAESSSRATAVLDDRTRVAAAALVATVDDTGRTTGETLYLPDETIRIAPGPGDLSTVADREEHKLGLVPVAVLANRERASDPHGRSEITPAIRYYTDATARTLLAAEVNREFYTSPQRYGVGIDPQVYGIDPEAPEWERRRKGWDISMGRMNLVPRDEDGQLPVLGQFTPSPPTPYIDQIRFYAQLVAAEAGIPAPYLGFATDNPASADAIRAGETRLVKRAQARQRAFGKSWSHVARIAMKIRDGSVDETKLAQLSVDWADAASPTPAADVDEAVKLVQAGILAPDSPVTHRWLGLSPQDQLQAARDARKLQAQKLAQALTAQPPPQAQRDPAQPSGDARAAA